MSSPQRVQASRSSLVILVAAVALGACGGDDGGKIIDAPNLDAPTDAPIDASTGNGQIAIRGNGITAASNKVVLAIVTPAAGGMAVGGVCVAVNADPFAFVEAVKNPGNTGNPCQLGAVGTYANGTYNVRAGIYTPGQQIPERCANTTVTVAGSGDVTLPAFAACPTLE